MYWTIKTNYEYTRIYNIIFVSWMYRREERSTKEFKLYTDVNNRECYLTSDTDLFVIGRNSVLGL